MMAARGRKETYTDTMKQTKDQKEIHEELTIKDLSRFKPQNNKVLCKKVFTNKERTTKSGIVLWNEQYNKNQWLSKNVDRVYEVVVLPEKLSPQMWITEIELEVGDTVFIKHTEALNCHKVYLGDQEYYLINYFDIVVAKRGEKVIPLNGHIIMEDVYKTQKALGYEKKVLDMPYGKVKWVGTKTGGYEIKSGKYEDLDANVDVKEGDVVFMPIFTELQEWENQRYLEYDIYASFDGDNRYFAVQRIDIAAVIN